MAQFQEIITGDSVELLVYLSVNNQPVSANQITSVQFIVQKPDLSITTVTGSVQFDGSGFYRWTDTVQLGEYHVRAKFHLTSGEIRSVAYSFLVIDPFNPPDPTPLDLIIEQVQLRLEDLFDSVEGGPWLKDQSLANFDASKISFFVQEALFDINKEMPPTNYTLTTFTQTTNPALPNPNMPLLVKGTLCVTIRHLMRSYTEQPIPQGGQIIWHDRTRYAQLWRQIYDVEYKEFIDAVRLAKRTELRLGHAASLIFSKQGRLYPYGSMRSRGIWRGYY